MEELDHRLQLWCLCETENHVRPNAVLGQEQRLTSSVGKSYLKVKLATDSLPVFISVDSVGSWSNGHGSGRNQCQ